MHKYTAANNTFNFLIRQKTGVFSSLWNWGVGKDTDSFDSEAPKVKPKPNKSGGILNCIASSVFGSDFLEVNTDVKLK